MKRTGGKILSILLAAVMILSLAPFGVLSDLAKTALPVAAAKSYAVGDIIEFGGYPQTQVTDKATIAALDDIDKNWISYGYYSGTGDYHDGNMQPGDWMRYADIVYDGDKYRAVTFDTYRPYLTGHTASSSKTYQDDNGYSCGTTYYFKWETLKWRVLDPAAGLVMSEKIIDSQAYQNTVYEANDEYWQDETQSVYANDYATSSIRSWLINDFYNNAFSSAEQALIGNTVLDNSACSTDDSQYDSTSTTDKIFLLSYHDMLNATYGFSSSGSANDTARRAQGTDYAKCQGLGTHIVNPSWWLRSPGWRSDFAPIVENDGFVMNGSYVSNTYEGVRPAFQFKSGISESSNPAGGSGSGAAGTATDPEPQPVTFKIDGVKGETDISFRQAWFSQDSKIYNHELAAFCSQFAMLGYDDNIEDDDGNVIQEKPNLRAALRAIGMFGISIESMAEQEKVNNFIAHRKITVGGQSYTLLFTGFIGSYKKQWYSNFAPGTGETHQGFQNAADYMYGRLNGYIRNHELAANNNPMIILITGHSRGAATANLVAARLIKEQKWAAKEHIYTYAFATPNSTRRKDRNDPDYKRIFNIVNPEDFVTKCLPAPWGYGRYGVTYTLPSKTNSGGGGEYTRYLTNMRSYYSKFKTGKTYSPFPLGEVATWELLEKMTVAIPSIYLFNLPILKLKKTPISMQDYFKKSLCAFLAETGVAKANAGALLISTFASQPTEYFITSPVIFSVTNYFVGNQGIGAVAQMVNLDLSDEYFAKAHSCETYCAYMCSMTKAELTAPRSGYLGSVNCPVDIEIYDKATGELVGRIRDNVVDEEIAAREDSVVMTVEGDEKTYWLPGNGDYDVRLIGNDKGTMDLNTVTIDGDGTEIDRVCFFDVPLEEGKTYEAAYDPEAPSAQKIVLADENGGHITPDAAFGAEELPKYSVELSAEGDGSVCESLTVPAGDYVTVYAEPQDAAVFLGWYQDGALISKEAEYRFRPAGDMTLVAKFESAEPSTTEPPATQPPVSEPAQDCLIGDVDGDGKIKAGDARKALRFSARLDTPTGMQSVLADVDGDGKVKASDARRILRYAARIQREDAESLIGRTVRFFPERFSQDREDWFEIQ